MTYELIIFDCDGVLIDSELLANRSEVEFLQSFGIEYDLSDYMSEFVGRSNLDVSQTIEQSHVMTLPENFWTLAEQRTLKVFQTELKPISGVLELIATTHQLKCVASSSSGHRLKATLSMVKLYDHFTPYIFSSEQVSRGKPAPDIFLFAAQQMHVSPKNCVVIEDSPHGVRAGVRAGMTVVGFTGGSHIRSGHQEKLLDEGATQVFSDMEQLSIWLSHGSPPGHTDNDDGQ